MPGFFPREVLLAHLAGLEASARTLELLPHPRQIPLAAVELCLGTCQLRLVGRRVDREQDLARCDVPGLGRVDLREHALHLRPELDGAERLRPARERVGRRDLLCRDYGHRDIGWRPGTRLVPAGE